MIPIVIRKFVPTAFLLSFQQTFDAVRAIPIAIVMVIIVTIPVLEALVIEVWHDHCGVICRDQVIPFTSIDHVVVEEQVMMIRIDDIL